MICRLCESTIYVQGSIEYFCNDCKPSLICPLCKVDEKLTWTCHKCWEGMGLYDNPDLKSLSRKQISDMVDEITRYIYDL